MLLFLEVGFWGPTGLGFAKLFKANHSFIPFAKFGIFSATVALFSPRPLIYPDCWIIFLCPRNLETLPSHLLSVVQDICAILSSNSQVFPVASILLSGPSCEQCLF